MPENVAYQQTLNYLYQKLPMFSHIGKAAIKKDLANTLAFCAAMGNPHEKFKSIHIAGTNGKGSVSHMLAAVMQEHGYKTGLYTSPHLVDFRERIRINGQMVSEEWVIRFVQDYHTQIDVLKPSFFEITVAMAFAAFAEAGVDIAIIETGLGGRLDSTNVITPLLSVITNISYDHKDLLGETLAAIALEKAGIIKPHVPVVIGEQQPETARVFFEQSIHKQSPLYDAEAMWSLVKYAETSEHQCFKAVHAGKKQIYDFKTDLTGAYQQHNIKTVLAATEILQTTTLPNLEDEKIFAALGRVKAATGLRGRWDKWQEHPLLIADVAHNAAGIAEVMQQWALVPATQKRIVVGFVKDKDVNEALAFFPKDQVYYFCQAAIPRALPAAELQAIAASAGLHGGCFDSVSAALSAACIDSGQDDAVLITGSFFVVGEALADAAK
jgi:dihydrofolate synthase/folylpolyglutamate synthase